MVEPGFTSAVLKFALSQESLSPAQTTSSGLALSKMEALSKPSLRHRGSQGRIYRETRKFVSVDTHEESKQRSLTISDPITHTRTACIIATRPCTVTRYHQPSAFRPPPDGSFDAGARYLTRESLGNDVIDGLGVIGTRETVTINAGVAGNSRPLVSTREFWYSPDLQINLVITRQDPREGTQVIRVVDFSRSEPDPAMFQVPSGFAVEDLHRGAAKSEP
jgi:hypothetical protein